MAITVRNGGQKWKRNTQAAQSDYGAGVAQPRRSWAQATAAAAGSYAQGVQTAIANGTFAKGVQRAGDQKYQQAVQSKGIQRFGAGVAASGDAYDQGFAPYAQVLQGLTLPDRGPRGDQGNLQRVSIVANALHEKKVSLQGGGR